MGNKRDWTLGLYEKALPSYLDMRKKLSLAKEAGYDFLELSVDESYEKIKRLTHKAAAKDLKDASESIGITYGSMCLSGHRKYPLGSLNETTRNRALAIMYGAIELSVKLGIRIIQLAGYDVYYEQSNEKTREYFCENLFKSVHYAAQAGVLLGFETMETPFMNTVEKAMYYVNALSSPYLQVYPDVGNVSNATTDPVSDLKTGEGHLLAAHLKETAPGIFRNMQFGEGEVDFDTCISELRRQGVGRFVSEFWYKDGESPIEYICKARKFLLTKFEGRHA